MKYQNIHEGFIVNSLILILVGKDLILKKLFAIGNMIPSMFLQDLQCQLKKEKEIASEDYKSQHLQVYI